MTSQSATASEGDPAEPTTKPQSFWASFSGPDLRTLAVTIMGTLIANLVTIMVVAIAIGLDRAFTRPSVAGPLGAGGVVYICGVLAFFFAVFAAGLGYQSARLRRTTGRHSRVLTSACATSGCATLIFVLVLLGAAAGFR